jgi:N-acetylmuramate 1-kinase
MSGRSKIRTGFIKACGWGDATSVVVAGDASNRSYERLTKTDAQTAILMNAPPEKGEDVRPFIKILEHLRKGGLEAPMLLGADKEHGFLLLEDLGDALFARICEAQPELEAVLYTSAVDVLLQLHEQQAPNEVAPYDLAAYLRETALVTDWYLPNATGRSVPDDVTHAYRAEIAAACATIVNSQPVLVLRDYHAENLLWLPERRGLKNVGLLDFQDALMGHPAYDLVSLLEDARRDTSATLQAEMKDYFVEKAALDKATFNAAYAILGAQRNLKIIGIFARLCVRDAKPQYVDMIPRVWAHLQNDLKHPQLERVKNWVDTHMPSPTPDILARIKGAGHAT